MIYSNKLVISPAARHHGITRMAHAVIPVSCHYKRSDFVFCLLGEDIFAILDFFIIPSVLTFWDRTHFVSSNTQQLALTKSASTKHSAFSLKLMTGM